MNIVKGDLLDLAENGEFDIIVHGANCFCTMGGGIARQIRKRYPAVYEADCATKVGDYNKLGTYTKCKVDPKNHRSTFWVVNAYTQFEFNSSGKTADVFEYVSFSMILQKLAHQFPKNRFGFPKIGMGLAGGDEDIIMILLEDFSRRTESTGGSVTIVEFNSN